VRVLRVDPVAPDPSIIATAASVLRDGGLVAFPTETVYGLGANALDESAIQRIFAAKGRPHTNPLIVHVTSVSMARTVVSEWPRAAQRLAEAFWPGPLTLVVPRASYVPATVSAGLDSVAVRVPAHPIARALIELSGVPVAAPSANRSTEVSPTTAQHVIDGLGDRVDLILDGGSCPVGIESTVVSLLTNPPRVLRPGMITTTQLAAILGDVHRGDDEGPATSPGQRLVHYAPKARIHLGRTGPTGESLCGRLIRARQPGETRDHNLVTIALPLEATGYAAQLYAALHRFDALGCADIFVDDLPDCAEWDGIRDRLTRAGQPRGKLLEG
jgi:L-threonylcarbamoyladenylate synthase